MNDTWETNHRGSWWIEDCVLTIAQANRYGAGYRITSSISDTRSASTAAFDTLAYPYDTLESAKVAYLMLRAMG